MHNKKAMISFVSILIIAMLIVQVNDVYNLIEYYKTPTSPDYSTDLWSTEYDLIDNPDDYVLSLSINYPISSSDYKQTVRGNNITIMDINGTLQNAPFRVLIGASVVEMVATELFFVIAIYSGGKLYKDDYYFFRNDKEHNITSFEKSFQVETSPTGNNVFVEKGFQVLYKYRKSFIMENGSKQQITVGYYQIELGEGINYTVLDQIGEGTPDLTIRVLNPIRLVIDGVLFIATVAIIIQMYRRRQEWFG